MANSTMVQQTEGYYKQTPKRQPEFVYTGWWTEAKGGPKEGTIWDLALGQHIIKPDMGNPFLKKGSSVSERVACSAMIKEEGKNFAVLRHTSGSDGVTYKCKEGDAIRLSHDVEIRIEKIDFEKGLVTVSIDKKRS